MSVSSEVQQPGCYTCVWCGSPEKRRSKSPFKRREKSEPEPLDTSGKHVVAWQHFHDHSGSNVRVVALTYGDWGYCH